MSVVCEACSDIWSQAKLVNRELLACCLILTPMMVSMTVDAELQQDTFGKDKYYLISGLLNTLGGIVSVIAGIVLGSLSDFFGRNNLIAACAFVMSIPPLLAAATENYWIFYISRACCMFNGAAFSIIMASVVDKIRKSAEEEEQDAERDPSSYHSRHNLHQQNNTTITDTPQQVVVYTPPNAEQEENQQQNEETQKLIATTANPVDGTPINEDLIPTERSEVSTKRTNTFSLTMLTFLISMMIGSGAGTAIKDVRHKFYLQLGLDAVGILWIIFFGIPKAPTAMQEVLEHEKEEEEQIATSRRNIHQPLVTNGEEEEGETTSTVAAPTNVYEQPENPTEQQQEQEEEPIQHAHSTKEKVMKLFRNKNLVLMFFVVFCSSLAEEVMQSSMLLYAKGSLDFDSREQQGLLMFFGVSSIFSLLVIGRIMTHYYSVMTVFRFAMFMSIFGCAAFGLAKEKWQLFTFPLPASVGILTFPLISTVTSLLSADEDAGSSQGFITAARFFAQGVSPTIFGVFLQAMEGKSYPLPGLPFVVAGVCPAIALAIAWFLPNDLGEKKKKDQ